MFIGEPQESPYDLRFNLMGFPIRVTWTFWLAAVIFGYNGADAVDFIFQETSQGILPWLFLWTAAMFGSILLHELGHAVAFRATGVDSDVVLYHFGGLAIPRTRRPFGRGRFGTYDQIVISAAGPLAQLVLAAIVMAVVYLAGYSFGGGPESGRYVLPLLPEFMQGLDNYVVGEQITDPTVFALVDFLLYINIWWALLNLLPVWPLDGGRIARELIYKFGGTEYHANMLSLVSAAGIALWMFSQQQAFGGILFVSLAISSYQMMTMNGRWR